MQVKIFSFELSSRRRWEWIPLSKLILSYDTFPEGTKEVTCSFWTRNTSKKKPPLKVGGGCFAATKLFSAYTVFVGNLFSSLRMGYLHCCRNSLSLTSSLDCLTTENDWIHWFTMSIWDHDLTVVLTMPELPKTNCLGGRAL